MREVRDCDFRAKPAAAAAAAASAPLEVRSGNNDGAGFRVAGYGDEHVAGFGAREARIDIYGSRRRPSTQHMRRDTSPWRLPLRQRAWAWTFVSNMALVLMACFLARPVTAATITNYENCLPDTYRYNVPTLLQWVPLHVDAFFDTETPTHTLRVTMWGNITGSIYNVTLPPPNSPDWTNPNKHDGKVLDEPDPDAAQPKLTTLHSKVDFLTYEPWSLSTNFCNDSLTNASCPLGPVFNTSSTPALYDLPSVTMQHDFFSSYAFASFSATFLIIYGDTQGTNIGCVSATIAPDLGGLSWMLKILPLIVLLFVGFATVFAGIFSPWGTSDLFHWTSNYGRDADLLRLVTPGFGDCLQYIQFIALTGGLTLNYPGFYQPIVSQASWSALMFNQSFVSKADGWQSLVDGIYVTDGDYGMEDLAQLVGMANVEDIWAGMAVWLLVIIASTLVLVQGGFLVQWIYRYVTNIPEQDLRAKNIPFSLGNVIRIVFNYFLLPIIALSTFQLVEAGASPAFTVALAVVTLVLILGFAVWLLYLIATTKPRAFLYDDLPTLLLYGPLYNTYSDEAAAFCLIPVLLTFLRGIAIGAVQPAGLAQLIILAICEVIHILTLHAFRPFQSPTSMNAYHTLFSAIRLVTVLLMTAFIPSLGVNEGSKGWIGYAILLAHAGVLVLGFLLNAIQTVVEVVARMLGVGGDDIRGLTRGGLTKIFGQRQLSRRTSRRGGERPGPSRLSQLSSSAMLDTADDVSKSGYGRMRSESAGSMGILAHHRQRSSSVMDGTSLEPSLQNNFDNASSFTPGTPGEASTFSFLPSPGIPSRTGPGGMPLNPSAPYYRPPRRRATMDNQSPVGKSRASWASGDLPQRGLGPGPDPAELAGEISRVATPGPYAEPMVPPPLRTDYSTREVDLYYHGVRGQRLNSVGPGRKLGTGPADPTGPMASASGWLRTMLGGKSKEKGKGFEVVRSSRMPPAMRARGGEFDESPPPEGIPVAMGVIRSGPIDSDDDDDAQRPKNGNPAAANLEHRHPIETKLLDHEGRPREDDEEIGVALSNALPITEASLHTAGGRDSSDVDLGSVPQLPRKSSRRQSDATEGHTRNFSLNLAPLSTDMSSLQKSSSLEPTSRLPFERTGSQRRLSSTSSMVLGDDYSQGDLDTPPAPYNEQHANYGRVSTGSISRVDRDVDLLGTAAELVNTRSRSN